jgi:molybdopterin synthase sulfur carrier subunit
MKINVKYFARYRETLGTDGLQVEGEFASVEALRAYLVQAHGAQVLNEQNLMCARNEDLCPLDEPLADGDEVAFFPTVTGG